MSSSSSPLLLLDDDDDDDDDDSLVWARLAMVLCLVLSLCLAVAGLIYRYQYFNINYWIPSRPYYSILLPMFEAALASEISYGQKNLFSIGKFTIKKYRIDFNLLSVWW